MVPLVLAHAAADLERIAEALGGQHADLGALLLEDGVGGDGRAVHEQRAVAQQRGQRQVELLGRQPQHAQHAFAGIGRHRRRLEDAHRAGASRSTMSVKVPPTSTPMRQGEVREGECESIWGSLAGAPATC
jgi:hypothetical protein